MEQSARVVGVVSSIWRYPVKSMQGEQLSEALITERGILGDRGYAVVDRGSGHVASAKHPRKWSVLLASRAAFMEPPQPGAPLPPVLITLPDGTVVDSARDDTDAILSRAFGREVMLVTTPPPSPLREANRAPIDGPEDQELIREEALGRAAPPGTFFDYAPLHILTTATLARLQQVYPQGRFDARRFRPNVVIAPTSDIPGFVENSWLGSLLSVGERGRLRLIDPCPRCVVTTLPQADLPGDPRILRVVAQQNAVASVTLAPGVLLSAVVGAYAAVAEPGVVRAGDGLYQLL